jgi:hypothetical protein
MEIKNKAFEGENRTEIPLTLSSLPFKKKRIKVTELFLGLRLGVYGLPLFIHLCNLFVNLCNQHPKGM